MPDNGIIFYSLISECWKDVAARGTYKRDGLGVEKLTFAKQGDVFVDTGEEF